MAYKHIGVAISGNEEDALLVNKALELARHNDAHLTLIHIDDGLSELYPGIYFPATEEQCDLLVCGHHHSFINRLMPAYRGMINKLSADLLIVPFIDK